MYGCAVPIAAIAPLGLATEPALNKDSTIHELSVSKEPVSHVRVAKKGSL